MESIVVKTVDRVAYIVSPEAEPGMYYSSPGGSIVLITSCKSILSIDDPLVIQHIDTDIDYAKICRGLIISGHVKAGTRLQRLDSLKRYGYIEAPAQIDLIPQSTVGMPHLSVVAATGSGKTTLAKLMVHDALSRGLQVIVFDVHGEYDFIKPRLRLPIPLCQMRADELLVLLGLHRLSTSPTKISKYIEYIIRAACKLSSKGKPLKEALKVAAEAVTMIDKLKESCGQQRLVQTQHSSEMCDVVQILRDELGNILFNALIELAQREEDRIASALLYIMHFLYIYEDHIVPELMIDTMSIDLTVVPSITQPFDAELAVFDFIVHRLMKQPTEKMHTIFVIEELSRYLVDDVVRKNFANAVRQLRKFGVAAVFISQKPEAEIVEQTRLIAGKMLNKQWINQLVAYAPQMPDELSHLLPNLNVGHFVYMDGQQVVPFRVVI